jgi:hypothetical protein
MFSFSLEGKGAQKRQAKDTEHELAQGHIVPMQLEVRPTEDVKTEKGHEGSE